MTVCRAGAAVTCTTACWHDRLGTALLVLLVLTASSAAAASRDRTDAERTRFESSLEGLVARLRSLGLQITADERTIAAATSEAAYFMFADRKEHRPESRPLELSDDGSWLHGKPLFARAAKKEEIRRLFRKLVRAAGYDRVWVYHADVHYGVSSHARFTLYRLGHRDAEKGDAKREVLLGDAQYVLELP